MDSEPDQGKRAPDEARDVSMSNDRTSMLRVFIDYSNVGRVRPGDHFTTRLLAHERGRLHEGETVELYGDAVEPIRAMVIKVHAEAPVVEFAVARD